MAGKPARFVVTGFAALLVLVSLACQSPQATGPVAGGTAEPKYGGIAVIATREDPPSNWDSMRTGGISLIQVSASATGAYTLIRRCRDQLYQLCPALAESWEASSDFTRWTFKVRNDVFWHDGTPFSAQDVKFWMDLAFSGAKTGDKTRLPATYKASLGDLKQVDVLEGNRVQVTLGRPTPAYLDPISDPRQPIAHPRHLMQPHIDAGDVNVGPTDVGWVGLGPFKVAKIEKGSQVQLRRFDKYWEKDDQGRQLPYLDGIDFPIMTDLSTIVAAFRAGRLDGGARGTGFGLNPAHRTSIEQSLGKENVQFAEIAGYRWNLGFNILRLGPWQDQRVRKALSLWIDKRAGIQAVVDGQSFLHTLMDPRSPWPSSDWQTWPGYNEATREKDRAEAKRLLAEAGYPGGFQLSILGQRQWQRIIEWLQGELAPLGVKVNIELVDVPTNSRRVVEGDWEGKIQILTPIYPEGLEQFLSTGKITTQGVSRHEDAKLPEIFGRFGAARSLTDRQAIYRELEKYVLLEQVHAIPLFDEMLVIPFRSYVKGLMVPPEEIYHNLEYATVWLDK